jgi:hypothetical protein
MLQFVDQCGMLLDVIGQVGEDILQSFNLLAHFFWGLVTTSTNFVLFGFLFLHMFSTD